MTPKQEAFARRYVETGNASEAYRLAYNAGKMKTNVIAVKAHELLKNGKVAVMVDELRQGNRARAQEKHEITVDKLTEMAIAAYDMAMSDDVQTASAAVSAVQVLGKLHGLIVDKTKNEHTGADGARLIPVINVTTTGRA